MTTAKHADFEALSAFVDGEAPEWADHVAGCAACRATAADLRALSAQVGVPAEPPPAAQREAAIAAALDALALPGAGAAAAPAPAETAGHEVHRRRFRRAPRPWAMPAVAAVVVALLGLSGVILSANRSTDENATTFAGPALDSKAESAVAGAPTAPVGDLGDVPDAATLRARAVGVATTSAARSSANSGAAADAGVPPSPTNTGGGSGGAGGSALSAAPVGSSGVSASGGSASVIAPNAVGTRPCEERARAREPGLGPVTYFATARRGNVPAYVLGFSTGPTVTLLMLAQDGCSELLRSAGP
jgi:hypothetical protein